MPSLNTTPLPAELVERLSALETRIRRLALLRGVGTVCLVLAVCTAAGLLMDFSLEVGMAVRTALLLIAGLATGIALWNALWRAWVRRYSLVELAAVAELAHPGLKERLLSTVELHEAADPEAWKGSALMRELLFRQTFSKVAELDFVEAMPGRASTRWAVAGGAACLLLALPFAFSPAGYGLLFHRFLAPWANLERASNLYFVVEGGDRIVARGTDVVVHAEPRWRTFRGTLPDAVWLDWASSPEQDGASTTGTGDSRRMELDSASGAYATTVPHVFRGFDYTISAGTSMSRRFRVDVVDAPSIAAIKLEVRPPAYTGRPATTIDGVTGRVAVFEGSRLEFQLAFNKPVERAVLEWVSANGSPPPTGLAGKNRPRPERRKLNAECKLADDRRSAIIRLIATEGGPFAISLADEFGLNNPPEPERMLVIVADQAPRVRLSESHSSQELRPTDRCTLSATAEDDVGVAALELHYRVNGGEEQRIAVPPARLGAPRVSYDFSLDFSELKLAEGDTVTCRARAADERAVPGPQEAWSETHSITIRRNSGPPGSRKLTAKQQDLLKSLDAIRTALDAERKQASDLYTAVDFAGRNNEEFTENEKLPLAAEQQKATGQEIEQLAARLAEHPFFEDLAADAQRLAEREMMDAAAQVEEAHQESNLAKKRDLLEKSREELAAAAKQLEGIRERFDTQAKMEQDLLELNRLAQQAEQLSRQAAEIDRQQAAIAKAAGKPADASQPTGEQEKQPQEIERQAEQLRKRQRDLESKLGELVNRHPQLLDAAQNEQLDRVARLAKRAERLAASQDQLARGLNDPAKDRSTQEHVQAHLTEETRDLADELGKAAHALSEEPLKSQPAGDQTEAARKLADAARQAMEQAKEHLAQNKVSPAADSVKQASAACRACAASAGKAASGAPASHGQGAAKVGAALVEAGNHLKEAGDRLSKSVAEAAGTQGKTEGASAAEPGRNGPGVESGKGPPGQDGKDAAGAFAGTAHALRAAAQSLAQAARQSQPGAKSSQETASGPSPAQAGGSAPDPAIGAQARPPVAPDLAALEVELKKATGRRWGELPGHLQTEILNAASKKPNGDYARLIKLYFKEIAQPRKPGDPATSKSR